MIVALVSLDTVWEDKNANRERVREALGVAAAHGADVAIFPEMTLTGFTMDLQASVESREDAPTLAWYRAMAREYSMAMIAGYVKYNEEGSKGENTAVFVSPRGEVLGSYVKAHPFSVSGEDVIFEKGNSLCTCTFGGAVIGLSICYDLRFPELYQGLSRVSQVIVNIASWPSRRISHWSALLRARAIENQVFMIGVNRTGSSPDGHAFVPSSIVFDPFGRTLEPTALTDSMAIYEFDPGQAVRERIDFPVKRDRRVLFYRDTCLGDPGQR